ncbi:hypothetical protein WJX73_007873 [Symbiochloris irregularis]|uniref:Allophanate hydrolase C-terminal domain-containing protein n=1 Tax=Symbiochloris irregularis TaxID=706552 RepID=A0AAW1NT20_9CHLO
MTDSEATLPIAVCGLHMTGQVLNWQLTDIGSTFAQACKTAPVYKMYALASPEGKPSKPGLVRVTDGGGSAFDLEVWNVPLGGVGQFLQYVPAPLAIGQVELETGTSVHGFLCEGYVANKKEGVQDISHMSGWIEYLKSQK